MFRFISYGRRRAAVLATLAALATAPAAAQDADATRRMTVIKTPWCSCCVAWADRMRAAGFAVTVEEREDLELIRRAAGVPEVLAGCHTARVGGYVLEGHVPPEAIDRLLAERQPVVGLSVPGMPVGSPGMGDDPQARYDVLSFDSKGRSALYHQAGR